MDWQRFLLGYHGHLFLHYWTHNLPVSVQLLPQHVWLLEQPCQIVRKKVWYVVCLAALTAMLRARGLMFSTLARTGLEPAVVETRAV